MKLLFDPDQARPSYLPKLEKWSVLAPLNKSAVEIAADYIGAIYKHVMVKIASKVPHDYLAMCEKKFVLSVPAVWSDKAKDRTLKVSIILTFGLSTSLCYIQVLCSLIHILIRIDRLLRMLESLPSHSLRNPRQPQYIFSTIYKTKRYL